MLTRNSLHLALARATRGRPMLDFTDSQLPEDELLERMALEAAQSAFERWQDEQRLKQARAFRFPLRIPVGRPATRSRQAAQPQPWNRSPSRPASGRSGPISGPSHRSCRHRAAPE